MLQRSRPGACVRIIVAAAMLCGIASPVWSGDKNNREKQTSASPAVTEGTLAKIDLTKADPSRIDLSKIDPKRLDLSKSAIKKIDMDKWDLSKIDVTKVDSTAAKWIQKRLKEEKKLERTLKQYAPGELERLQQANLKWLREPPPLEIPTLSRKHAHTAVQIAAHAQAIDAVVAAKLRESEHDVNPIADDNDFVRRVYVNVAGRIPTAQEARAFLVDRTPTKRRDLIDRLLLSEDYPSQMFNWLADMLRVADLKSNQGENESYQAWLIDQVTANRPWSKTVYDLLTAEGDLVTEPAVGWLVRDDGMPLDSLSNTLTTFMGANVACAQCHDHPFTDFTQRNFYELAAFFGSTDVPGKNVRGAAKVLKNRYHSVTTVTGKYLTLPKDYQYDDAAPESRVNPRFPMLTEFAPRRTGSTSQPLGRHDFAAWMTAKNNHQFAATIANRLWAKAFGLPVMAPVTEMDDLDAADNPALIKTLARVMQELDFDLMAFQRVLYNTRAFQAQVSATPDVGTPYRFQGPVLRRLTAEETWDSLVTLVEGDDVNAYHRDRRTLTWSYNVFKPGFLEHHSQEVKNAIEDDKVIAAADSMASRLAAEQRGGKKRGKSSKKDDDRGLHRASEMSQPADNDHFLRSFGQSERELADTGNTEGGIPQSLALMNGPVGQMLAAPDSYLMSEAKRLPSDADRVEFAYMSFLARKPTEAERRIIASERIALPKLVWILLNTREFMFLD